VQLPDDPAEHLPVVTPGLAIPAVGGQQRLHVGKRLVGKLQHAALLGWWASRNTTLSTSTPISSEVRLEC
jgi:hypothetical protein